MLESFKSQFESPADFRRSDADFMSLNKRVKYRIEFKFCLNWLDKIRPQSAEIVGAVYGSKVISSLA